MKKLTCELCGSNGFVKEEGLYVCQSCGTKYSLEEAKKMMIDGTVEVTGTVQVDRTSTLKNLLSLAKNAYERKEYTESFDYTKRILEIDPTCIDAWKVQLEACRRMGKVKEYINAGQSAINFSTEAERKQTELFVYSDFAETAVSRAKRSLAYLLSTFQPAIDGINDMEREASKEKFEAVIRVWAESIARQKSKIVSEAQDELKENSKAFEIIQEIPLSVLIDNDEIREKAIHWMSIRDVIMKEYKKRMDYCEWKINTWEISPWQEQNQLMSKRIEEAQQKAESKKQKRIVQYWNEHTEEKRRLDAERSSLEERIMRISRQRHCEIFSVNIGLP